MPDNRRGKPKILMLLSDEHNAAIAGFSGDPLVRTPNLDRLAEGGAVFENAYTPSPICVPARQCILAGQYPATCGCEGWLPLPERHMTYPRWFALDGYATAAFGKVHLVGPDQLQGFESRPVGDVGFRIGGKPVPVADRPDPLDCGVRLKWSDEKEVRKAGLGDHPDATDRLTVAGFESYLDTHLGGIWYDRHDRELPRLLYGGFHNPHYPYQTTEERLRYYLPRVTLPANPEPFDHPFLGRSPWLPPGAERDRPTTAR